MGKVIGIFVLLVAVCAVTASLRPDAFLTAYNIENVIRWTALFGIISVGVAFVIITGGIDLSIGSVVGLTGCALQILLVQEGWHWTISLVSVLAMSLAIGLAHGLLITKLGLQPFVVTLCGLLLYRGIARGITNDRTVGFGSLDEGALTRLTTGEIPLGTFDLPAQVVVFALVALAAAVFLGRGVWGRYLYALGSNRQAAQYAGINTDRVTIMAYMVSSGLAGLAGVLFALHVGAVQPASHGEFYELYAIAAAVLGGCSLRGGVGLISGVVVGATIMCVLRNSINLLDIPTQLEFAIIGGVILIGVSADEIVRRIVTQRTKARGATRAGPAPP